MQFSIRSLVILVAMAAVFCVYATELLEMVFYYHRYYIPIAVLLLIGTSLAVYTLSLFAGVLLGLSLRPDGVFGLVFWKSHIVKAFKRTLLKLWLVSRICG